ncbi:hypothetical protein [Sinorhizobium sp. BG8]|uniref:hypothetical protein n=1 Tax=Sinorhizobium sp. BG8 TaxID=2613773 RepID=UPI00193D0421|nr:hypothetical protein [Sinorhizobium sp. BG8]QRM56679.1 hypothetical protein F3Y30_20685 [Sinorhizobium sp. BG8]
MPTLTVDLQEGFEGDEVVIAVDGRELFRKQGVKTRHQIGLAERVRLEVEAKQCSLRVSLPERSLKRELSVDCAAEPTLAVSLIGGQIDIRPFTLPGYL